MFKRKLASLLVAVMLFTIPALASDKNVSEYDSIEQKLDVILEYIDAYSLDKPQAEDLLKGLILSLAEDDPEAFTILADAMINSVDPYGYVFKGEEYAVAYYPPDYVGIGVSVAKEGEYIVITEVFSGSPAISAGLKAGDRLLSVDETNVVGKEVDEVGGLVRGEKDSEVTLTILRSGEEITFTMTRMALRVDSVTYEVLPSNMAYIKVRDFEDITIFFEFVEKIELAMRYGVDGYIIDLRNNGGGDVSTALNMANILLCEEGLELITFTSGVGEDETYYSMDTGYYLKNIAVLINGNSYSSSEVMAGILKDHGKAVVIGEVSGGKGRGQSHIALKDGDVLVITTSEATLPVSGVYHGVGIIPDIVVENIVTKRNIPGMDVFDFAEPVSEGQQSPNALGVNMRLKELGYAITECGSTFNPEGASALKTFQRSAFLNETGIADEATMKALDIAVMKLLDEEIITDKQLETAVKVLKENLKK